MEKHRVSLEVAKKMKQAEYKQDKCDAYWVVHKLQLTIAFTTEEGLKKYYADKFWISYAAPCVGDLIEELWRLNASDNEMLEAVCTIQQRCADGCGLMWLNLKEKGLPCTM